MCESSPPPDLTRTCGTLLRITCAMCAHAHCWLVLCAAVCGTGGLLTCECAHLATRVPLCGCSIPTRCMQSGDTNLTHSLMLDNFMCANQNSSLNIALSPFSFPLSLPFFFSILPLHPSIPPSLHPSLPPSLHPSLPPFIQFLGNDILHVYNKQQVKHRLSTGGLYIANTKPSGFCIEVSNFLSSTTVMVGVRVQLGCRSLERAPSFIEVFGRTHNVSVCVCAFWR